MPTITRTFRHQNGLPARGELVVVRNADTGVVVASDITNNSGLFAAWLEVGHYTFEVNGVSVSFEVNPGGELPPAGGYVHTQSSPAAQWTVNHNLGVRKPVVVFLDDDPGTPVETDEDHVSDNTLLLIFPTPVSGTAHL